MFKTLKNRKPERSGRQLNTNDGNCKQNGYDKCAFHSRNISTNSFPNTSNPIPTPRNHAVKNNREDENNTSYLMSDNFLDNAEKDEFENKENPSSRQKYKKFNISKRGHVKSPVYFTYDQKANSYEFPIRFTENVREQVRPHEKNLTNHCALGSQKSNASKTKNVESTVMNSNLELLKKSVEIFKIQKEGKLENLGNMLRVTPSSIGNKEFSKKTKSQGERTETLLKSKNIYRCKDSNRTISSMKSSNNSLYSPSIPHRTTIRIRRKPTFSDDVLKSRVSNTNKRPKTSKYYIRSHNTLAPNSKRQFSRKSTQTTNDDDCCLRRSSSPPENLKNKLFLDKSGYYSFKQQSPHSLTPSAMKNKNFFKRKCFLKKRIETMMKSKNRDRYSYNNSHRTTASRNPSIHSSSSNQNQITTHRSSKRSHRTQKQESNDDFIRTQISPAPSTEGQSSRKSTVITNDDKFCLHKSPTPPITLNKSSAPEHSSYYSSKQPDPPSVPKSTLNVFYPTPSLKPSLIHNSCFFNSPFQPLTSNDCYIEPPKLKKDLSGCSSVPILKIPTNQDNCCFEPIPQPLIQNENFGLLSPLNIPVSTNIDSFVEPFQSPVKEQIQPPTPNIFCFEPPSLNACFSIPIIKTTADQDNCCFEPLPQPERQNASFCSLPPLNIPVSTNIASFVEPFPSPVKEPIQPQTPNIFCHEPPSLSGSYSIPIIKTTADQDNCCFDPLPQPEKQDASFCSVSPLNMPANQNNFSSQSPLWEPIQNSSCCFEQNNFEHTHTPTQTCFCYYCQENLKLATAMASYLSPTHNYCECFNGCENVGTIENLVYYQPCNYQMLNAFSYLPYQQAENNQVSYTFRQPRFIPSSSPSGRKPICKIKKSKTLYPYRKEDSKTERKKIVIKKTKNLSSRKKSKLENRLTSNPTLT